MFFFSFSLSERFPAGECSRSSFLSDLYLLGSFKLMNVQSNYFSSIDWLTPWITHIGNVRSSMLLIRCFSIKCVKPAQVKCLILFKCNRSELIPVLFLIFFWLKLKTNMLHFFMGFLSRISENNNKTRMQKPQAKVGSYRGVVEIPPHKKIWKSLELIDSLLLSGCLKLFPPACHVVLINDALKFKCSYSKTDVYSRKNQKRG